jgi:hypothetical protein
MRPLQLLIAALLGANVVLLVVLSAARCDCEVPERSAVRIVEAQCYSCGSGNGPTADAIASLVDLWADDAVVAIDGRSTAPTRRAELPELIDASVGRQRSHGEVVAFDLVGARGLRRVIVELQ